MLDRNLGLERRDWIMAAMERQRALSPRAGAILRLDDVSSDAFLDLFYAGSRPVVIAGAMDDWPALQRWTPDYLRRTLGPVEIEYQGGRTTSADFELHKDRFCRRMPFDAYIDMITADGSANDAYITAYNSGPNAAALAPLQADLGHLDRFLKRGPGMLWVGPAGTFTPLHFDLTNNLLAQIVGTKRLILVPPSETSAMANHRHVFSDVHDLKDPANLDRFPAARQVRYFELDLRAGELLYIPVGWWHQVRSLEFSVMLTYTNFLWPNDAWESFPPDLARDRGG